MKQIAIVHYNTPELTEACILSLRKTGCGWPVVVLDNSDTRPFTKRMKGVKVLNNRKGQLIDFEAELAKYPNKEIRMAALSNHGSVKHMMSVQFLWTVCPEGFILVESDVLITRDIRWIWQEEYAAVGKAQWFRGRRNEKDRLLPFVCYMNVPLLVENGARYYDPQRSWNLQPGEDNPGNWWDTGACLFDDIGKTKPQLVARLYSDLDKYYLHYTGGSWRQNDVEHQTAWLAQHRSLWFIPENKDAKIYICAHSDFEPVVSNPVYEVVDIRKSGDVEEGVPGSFYSEMLHMHRVSKRKKLPKYIGFCHYRRYFNFMDDVPDIAEIMEQYGAIVSAPIDLKKTMREQYATWGNVEDLDICTTIINEQLPAFAPTWNASLNKRTMHPCNIFIMNVDAWREMLSVAWAIVSEYLRRIGCDIDVRVMAAPEAYHLDKFDIVYERRVGGQLCERIVSAWFDWKFPNAKNIPIKVTADKIVNPEP